jgi:hypothetical protein
MTSIRHYNETRGAFEITDIELDKAFVTLTARREIGGGVLAYPQQFDIEVAELRRLLATPLRTKPKPLPERTETAHVTSFGVPPQATPEAKLIS